jgi:glycosyltransferase involved in cell wall biosynthesis
MAATFQLCDGAVVTNPYLAHRASEAFSDGRPVYIIPNFLERDQQALSESIWAAKQSSGWSRDGRLHLGYFSGTPTHNRDFAVVASTLARLMDDDDRLRLRIVGFLESGIELRRHQSRIEVVPLQDYLNLQRQIGEVEINLVPLQDNVFTNCKSELKWFEAAVVGTLTIATPTYTFRDAISHGKTGWLASAQKWEPLLIELLNDIRCYQCLASQARAEALKRHGWRNQAKQISKALFSL